MHLADLCSSKPCYSLFRSPEFSDSLVLQELHHTGSPTRVNGTSQPNPYQGHGLTLQLANGNKPPVLTGVPRAVKVFLSETAP